MNNRIISWIFLKIRNIKKWMNNSKHLKNNLSSSFAIHGSDIFSRAISLKHTLVSNNAWSNAKENFRLNVLQWFATIFHYIKLTTCYNDWSLKLTHLLLKFSLEKLIFSFIIRFPNGRKTKEYSKRWFSWVKLYHIKWGQAILW